MRIPKFICQVDLFVRCLLFQKADPPDEGHPSSCAPVTYENTAPALEREGQQARSLAKIDHVVNNDEPGFYENMGSCLLGCCALGPDVALWALAA